MLRGLQSLMSVLRELPVYDGLVAPAFRWLFRIITWPLLQIIMKLFSIAGWGHDPELRIRIHTMVEHWLRGSAFLLAASQNFEQLVFGVSRNLPLGEGNWILFFGRLMLAASVVESMPPRPEELLHRQRRCGWPELCISVRHPLRAWRIWKHDLQRLLVRHLVRSSPVLVIVTTVAPGWPGWVAFSLALLQYLLLGTIRCQTAPGDVHLETTDRKSVAVERIPRPLTRVMDPEVEDGLLTNLEQRQRELAHHVKMVCRGFRDALIVYSAQGGTGKSYTVSCTLQDEGVPPVLINSHVTAMELYRLLYRYRDGQVLFLDDVDGIFASSAHLGLLRSALFGEPRIVTYLSSSLPKDLPQQFVFSSRVIFCVNTLPKNNDAFNAVLTRCGFFELSASNAEILDVMRAIAGRGYGSLTPNQCLEVVDFVEANAGDVGLSLRMLAPCLNCVLYASEEQTDWRPLVLTQLTALQKRAQRNGNPRPVQR